MDQNGSQMWFNPELDPAVLIPRLYDIGQKKNEYKTKVEFHYRKLLESCGTGDKTGAKQSYCRVQVFGNDYFTWYFLYIDKLDLCEHIEQLDVPALRLDARSEAVYLRLMIDHGERYYDEYFNESMDITWELGSYAEPNLSDDSMHMWWYINFTDPNLISLREYILEEDEYLLDNMNGLGDPSDATCDGLSDCESESGNIHEPHMDSPFENGCDTAVTALKAGSLVIIEYLQTKIATLHNEMDALKTPDSRIDGFALYEELWLSHKRTKLDELETIDELQKLSTEIISRLQRRIGDMEMELMLLRALNHCRPDHGPCGEISTDTREVTFPAPPSCESIVESSYGSHAGCLVIIQHLQSRIATMQHELNALKRKQTTECNLPVHEKLDSGCDTQSCISDISPHMDDHNLRNEAISQSSSGEICVHYQEPESQVVSQMALSRVSNIVMHSYKTPVPSVEIIEQPPSGGPKDPGNVFVTSDPSGGRISGMPRKTEANIVMHKPTPPPGNRVYSSGVSVHLNLPSSGESVLWNKNKWFPDQQGGSSVKLKRSQAFASNVLCLL